MLNKKLISIIAMVALVFATNLVAPVKAASITNASDRISTSKPGAAATHYVTFKPSQPIPQLGYMSVTLPSTDGAGSIGVGAVTCPGTSSASIIGSYEARCGAATGEIGIATATIAIANVTNPNATSSYSVLIETRDNGGKLLESVTVKFATMGTVQLSASVNSALTFSVSPLPNDTLVNGASTTAQSATTSLNFGTLQVGTSSILGQQLDVTTNATYGYKVTVEQNQDLTSNSGATIDSFNMGAAPAAPIVWANPVPVLDSKNTYGHMGFTTDDASLSSSTPTLYQGGKWMGFTGTSTQEVMYHNGPSDGSTQDKGRVKVAYRINITALQEAGDYTNTLTYVATPTY